MTMNKYHFFIFAMISAISSTAFAQNVIYKCTDSDGNISYLNEPSNKNCEKTNLAKVDKSGTLNKTTSIAQPNNVPPSVNINISNNEQVVKDQKRLLILQGELEQEKNQLKTVSEMLKKVEKSADAEQIAQLQKMVDAHKRNILALEKEIGVKSAVDLSKNPTPPLGFPKNLPFSLPKEAGEVEIVTPPSPPLGQAPKAIPQPPMGFPQLKPAQTSQNQPTLTDKLNSILNNQQKPIIPQPMIKAEEPKAPEVVRKVMEEPMITNKSLKKKSELD